jgi:uncharacterized membrane protein
VKTLNIQKYTVDLLLKCSLLITLLLSFSIAASSVKYIRKQSVQVIQSQAVDEKIENDKKATITGRIGLYGNNTFSELALHTFNDTLIYIEPDSYEKDILTQHQHQYAEITGQIRIVIPVLANNKKVKS